LKDFHTTKRSAVLAERLSCASSRSGDQNPANFEHGFSDMFKTFVRQMLQKAENGISTLLTEKNSSLVLQVSVSCHHLLQSIELFFFYFA
jgi:nucleolar protein 9